MIAEHLEGLPDGRPVLIAGPTASGKSALALHVARAVGGVVVNADALQVFDNWRILTARPSLAEEEVTPHLLYGHVPGDKFYSVGHWLRDVAPILNAGPRPIIVGGTGLYFTALTEGLADIPATPDTVRAEANTLRTSGRVDEMIAALDADTAARIDQLNPMRVQRAWEVQRTTGRGLAAWQDDTPPPLLPLEGTLPLVLAPERDWLRDRIARRFDKMLTEGALDEARKNVDKWDANAPSAKAIGAAELIAHVKGELSLDEARTRAIVFSQQFAKRQGTWFRSRMQKWDKLVIPTVS